MKDLIEFFDPPVTIDWNVQPAQALEFLKGKGLKTSFSYADVAAREHAVAFTVAKMLDNDLLADVKASLEDALASGKPFQQWADEIIPVLQAKGWWGRQKMVDPMTGQTIVAALGTPGRLQTIFRTNLHSAYSVGEWEQIIAQATAAPYLMYDAVDDFRTRPQHAAWDGKVRPVNDAFWKTHMPPNGWNCRCGVIQLSKDDLEELGLEVSPPERLKFYEWKNPRTGKVEKIPEGLDPGFDHNPGADRLEHLAKLAAEKAKALPPDAARAALQGLTATQSAAEAAASEMARQALTDAAAAGARLAQAGKAAERAAAAQIQKALTEKTPYLAKALQDTQKLKGAKDMTATEILAVAKEKAAKAEASALLSQYKSTVLQGKKPSAKAQAVFDALPDEAQAAITELLQVQLAEQQLQAAAAAELVAIAAKPNSVAGKALAKITQAGKKPTEVLAEVQAAAQAASLKQVQAQTLAGYKKAVQGGKTPTPAQKAAFDALTPDDKAKLLAELEKAKGVVAAAEAPAGAPVSPVTDFNPGSLVQIGPQRGSNPGGLFQDTTTGTQWYIKRPKSAEIARNEVLAARLYQLAGVEVPDLRLTTFEGAPAVASKIIPDLTKGTAAQLAKASDGFVVDAWLANWDVVGLNFDNLLLRGGAVVRVDTGGALRFRAQGGLKGAAWGNKVGEIDSLRNAATNPQAAQVFGSMTPAQLEASAARVLAISDDEIRKLVDEFGPLDAIEREQLVATLIARKADIAQRFPNAAPISAKVKAQAIEAAEFAARDGLAEVNSTILTAIKGIASRAAKGAALEAKDVQRVAEARKALQSWTREHGAVLTADSLQDAQSYFGAWLDQLDEAVAAGAGSPAKWSGAKFDAFTARLKADPSRVKVALPQAGVTFSQQQAKVVMTDALGSSAASLNVPKGPGYAAFKAVPLEHQRAISAYTGSHYRAINEALREGRATAAQLRYRDLLNEALALSPKYQGKVTRGMDVRGAKLDKYLAAIRAALLDGEPYIRPAFISTSMGERAAFGGNIVEHIVSRSGVHVKAISLHERENEVLLPAGLRFNVTKLEQRGDEWHVYLEEIDG